MANDPQTTNEPFVPMLPEEQANARMFSDKVHNNLVQSLQNLDELKVVKVELFEAAMMFSSKTEEHYKLAMFDKTGERYQIVLRDGVPLHQSYAVAVAFTQLDAVKEDLKQFDGIADAKLTAEQRKRKHADQEFLNWWDAAYTNTGPYAEGKPRTIEERRQMMKEVVVNVSGHKAVGHRLPEEELDRIEKSLKEESAQPPSKPGASVLDTDFSKLLAGEGSNMLPGVGLVAEGAPKQALPLVLGADKAQKIG